MANVLTTYMFKQVLVDLTDHTVSGNFDGVLHGCKIDLYTNNPSLDASTVIGGLTIASYTGYSQGSITFSTIFDQADLSYAVQGGLTQFVGPSSGAGATVHGYAVTDSTGALIWAEAFATPISLAAPDDAVFVGPQLVVGDSDGTWGSGVVVT